MKMIRVTVIMTVGEDAEISDVVESVDAALLNYELDIEDIYGEEIE